MKRKRPPFSLSECEKEFYCYLGLLSVKFSEMENNIFQILLLLLGGDEELINQTLLENNSIHQNIELLKKIDRIVSLNIVNVGELVAMIGHVKKNRNLFIHGVWMKPFESGNDILCHCEDFRLRYEEEKTTVGEKVYATKKWQTNSFTEYSLTKIVHQIHQIEDIIFVQKQMLAKLRDR